MDFLERDSFSRKPASPPASPPLALGVLTLFVYFTGFATVAAWFALMVLGQPARAPAERAPGATSAPASLTCSVCGVVEQVEELPPGSLQITGDKGEGFVVLLALLTNSGDVRAPRAPLYETAVRHDDGSVRVVRDSSTPKWKRGDRVRVIKGRIEPGSGAVPVSEPAERTSSPGQPIAQGR